MPWIAFIALALQIVTGLTAADAPVPATTTAEWTAREIPVPIQVVGPGDERKTHEAEISVVALGQEAGRARRGKLIARAATGPTGAPCTVRLAPSLDRVLIEARQVGGGSVLGSTVIAFDRSRSVWRVQTGLVTSREARVAELLEAKPSQPTISVKIPDRVHTRVYVIASHHDRLPNFAEVMIFTTSGKCVRRGFPRPSGEGFDAERDRPIDPRYQRLLVVARGWQNGQLLTGSVLLVFDHNNWRPATRYEDFVPDPGKRSGRWPPATDYDAGAGQFEPIADGASWSPSQIRVPVPAHTLPLWKPGEMTAWPVQSEGMGADAPPASASACCQDTAEPAGEEILKQLGFSVEPLASPAVEELAASEAAIVDAGRPLSPDHRWADFGHRWIRGPSNMYWQAAIDTAQP